MKKIVFGLALAAMMSTSAMAAKIGVSIISFDNNFQNLLKQGMEARAKELGADIRSRTRKTMSASSSIR